MSLFNDKTYIELLETLRAISQDDINSTTSDISNTTETPEIQFSFFYSIYAELYSRHETIPRRLESERDSPPTFQTYEHPFWFDWKTVWDKPPVMFDPIHVFKITAENAFHSALFRLSITGNCIIDRSNFVAFQQGTTIAFKGYDYSFARHIVEWCQWTDDHIAYLKVVGIDSSGRTFSWKDPDYPTFILEIPACIANVRIPEQIRHLIPIDQEFEEVDRREWKFCWACC